MRHILCLSVLITLMGCVPGDNERTVAEAVGDLAPAACERMYRCDHARFREVFSDVDACIDHVRAAKQTDASVNEAQVDECAAWLEASTCDADPAPCAWANH